VTKDPTALYGAYYRYNEIHMIKFYPIKNKLFFYQKKHSVLKGVL